MAETPARNPSWQASLAEATPGAHLVQIYTDDAFLARAVACFIGEGLRRGEAAVIVATPAHARAFAAALTADGVDVVKAHARGRLTLLNAQECLAKFIVAGAPDHAAFDAMVKEFLDRLRSAGHGRVRLFGEMVDLLWTGEQRAALDLEDWWNEVLRDTRLSLLCAYRMDNFDSHVHRSGLVRICERHSELIPVADYERLDRAVDRAYEDVFGSAGDCVALREQLVRSYPLAGRMPAAQAALLALRDVEARTADALLERARHYYGG